MSKLKVYHYPQCGTCRNAIKSLQAKGHELELHHIKETPPSAAELDKLVELSGLELKKFFNTSGEVYKSMGLKDKLAEMSREEQLQLLSSNGMLIKRPIVTDGKTVTVGYKEEAYEQAWGKSN
ncbi:MULTISPECIES: arsenate reductase family protein [Paenibacillus]|mgnify:CR=1 FL=1|jgi:arsenate reductase|uniref:Arsenate reductase n=1 Tax=Paenibacillus barengoltzii J12 TaxID=935846 RepID=A0ABY1M2J0_9BACL|nr:MULTISPECIES: arsenate reductase family protein [Paenibacillus]MEC2345608.1 arsenate reductase family protein [Paenibacillus barengoltzii]SMF39210.1 arsenate reductase [Paenibacillus barengoltzii]SMF60655.1 arsenate reductase [Paenibacillus barengoltzii J12]